MSSIHPGIRGAVGLISGGASGIGAATARLFAARGATVVIGDVVEKEGGTDEVARLIAFLASSEASYCTGGAFSADGGLTAGLAAGLPRDR
jgi:NAD(P)-dependent dehydrogenase (short-subunit alcohol dehydrogenase family)